MKRYRCAECLARFHYDPSLVRRAVTIHDGSALCAHHAKYARWDDDFRRYNRSVYGPSIPPAKERSCAAVIWVEDIDGQASVTSCSKKAGHDGPHGGGHLTWGYIPVGNRR